MKKRPLPTRKIESLQKKVARLTEKLENDILAICQNSDYHNSSIFSYNIDRLKAFNEGIQNFKPYQNQ